MSDATEELPFTAYRGVSEDGSVRSGISTTKPFEDKAYMMLPRRIYVVGLDARVEDDFIRPHLVGAGLPEDGTNPITTGDHPRLRPDQHTFIYYASELDDESLLQLMDTLLQIRNHRQWSVTNLSKSEVS